jgi:CubicO group peptidase (beta-lactamase class C family)
MTATLIALYVDRGAIRFEDTIGNIFAGEEIHPGYAGVSIEQLLQHRGGAPREIPSDIWSQMRADGTAPEARSAAVGALLARGPRQSPGSYVYSNSGYMIAGAALERALGEAWEVTVQRELFGSVGMASCGFGPPTGDQPRGHRVETGHLVGIAPGPDADNPPSLGPAGTVHCSLADWGKFLALHLAGARGEPTLLSQQSMTRLQTPPTGGDYAGGWSIVSRNWAGGTALTHSGSNTLWYSTAWLTPAKNTIFAVVTNRGGNVAASAVDSVLGPLISRYAA